MTQTPKVTEEKVYAKFVHFALSIMDPTGGAINIAHLASWNKVSKYQMRKIVHSLRDKGMVELKCFNIPSEDEVYPPYWAYVLTEKGRDTDYFRQESKKHDLILQECFGI
ncbi:hypothetical protein MKY95_23285 [Paenibacillus sp. FSL P4-0176]|uniref:hypothetical protein n=1 Tax=Paenibacillus sp. FSL P4-0176 TaxID=2921631 RepID=UPI0030D22C52